MDSEIVRPLPRGAIATRVAAEASRGSVAVVAATTDFMRWTPLIRNSQRTARPHVVIKVRPAVWSHGKHKRGEASRRLCGGKTRRCGAIEAGGRTALDHADDLLGQLPGVVGVDIDSQP